MSSKKPKVDGEFAGYVYEFGAYALRLRRARGLTQEQIADRSGLSADTIRRLEHADFAPSLVTLCKVGRGFRLPLSTMFLALESAGVEPDPDLAELVTLLKQHPEVPVRALIALVETWAQATKREG